MYFVMPVGTLIIPSKCVLQLERNTEARDYAAWPEWPESR